MAASESSEDWGEAPITLTVVDSASDVYLVAQKPNGSQMGIVCDPNLGPILRSFVHPTNIRLGKFWKQYQLDRGGNALLWDLARIASALSRLHSVPGVRNLLRFTTATDVFHNACQASLMLRADELGLAPRIVPATAAEARPDFSIDPALPIEVKTISGSGGIELGEDGVRIPPPESDRLAFDIQRKIRQGQVQAGPNGSVAVAIWCDLAGNAISRVFDTQPLEALTFAPRHLFLLLYPSEGDHDQVFVSVPIEQAATFASQVARRLKSFTAPRHIPFTGRFVGVVRSDTWTTIGRRIQIGNWEELYAPYELTALSSVTFASLRPLAHLLARVKVAREKWFELIAERPIEKRLYSGEEVRTDPRFAALFALGTGTMDVLGGVRALNLADAIVEGRPKEDADRLWTEVMDGDRRINISALFGSQSCYLRLVRISRYLSETLDRL